jgi:Bifunctional DNA primase/polymerase, N-terminal
VEGGVSALGKAAVDYARRGWHVFPVAPRGKTPLTKNGLKDASTDSGLVAARWDERPNANIGLACGPSGLLVVDLDGEEALRAWGDLTARHGLHPRTLVSRTGKGHHLVFTGDGPSSAGRIAPKVDTRGRGGYIVLPPSVHGSGASYCWLDPARAPVPAPEWLFQLLEYGNGSSVGERRELPKGVLFTPYGLVALERLAGEMASTPEGERNATLNALAFRCGRLNAAGQLAEYVAHRDLIAAAQASGLDVEEAERTFRSGFAAGLLRPVVVEELA